MIDCKECEAQISAFIDGELGEEDRFELLEHMSQCEKCSRTYAALCAVSEAVSEHDTPSDELHDRIMSAVRKDTQANKKRKRPWMSVLSAAACVALVLFLGSHLDLFSAERTPDATDNAPYLDSSGDDAEAGDPREDVNTLSVSTAMSADELKVLLSAAADQTVPDGFDAHDEIIKIYDEAGKVLLCTVAVENGCVYADFGDGEYVTRCTPAKLHGALYD